MFTIANPWKNSEMLKFVERNVNVVTICFVVIVIIIIIVVIIIIIIIIIIIAIIIFLFKRYARLEMLCHLLLILQTFASPGSHCTLVAHSKAVELCLESAKTLEAEGIDCEVRQLSFTLLIEE